MENPGDGGGPTSERVAANVRSLRRDRGLDLSDLSARLETLGHPLGINVLSKIERQKRRIDVDDLMALALALDVTPNRLLLPAEAVDEGEVHLTEGYAASKVWAWVWAVGDQPLPQDPWTDHAVFNRDRHSQFVAENRLHAPDSGSLSTVDVEEHAEGLELIARAVHDARGLGVPMEVVRGWFRLNEVLRLLSDRVEHARSKLSDQKRGAAQ